MKITILLTGRTNIKYIEDGFEEYKKRINHYIDFKIKEIPSIKNSKNLSINQQKDKEAVEIFRHISDTDVVILLDEKGKEYSSRDFANYLQVKMNCAIKNLVFITGGPYGFAKDLYDRANDKISMSKMTFSHQLIRIIFAEQLYRAFTILRNEPYHNE